MVKPGGHGAFIEHYVFDIVAITAGIFVYTYMLMPLEIMTLVAVQTGTGSGNMQAVGKHAFFGPAREFLKRVAPEAGQLACSLIMRDNFICRVGSCPGFPGLLAGAADEQCYYNCCNC